MTFVLPKGIRHIPAYLDRSEQVALVETIRSIVEEAPLYTPHMPRNGQPMSVRMTNCGTLGWYTDKAEGYRYISAHPVTSKPWPAIPLKLMEIWQEFSGVEKDPEACLINFYAPEAKMGLHADIDEKAFDCPVVSVSLGDDCLFRVGGLARKDKTQSFRLCSGDIVVIGGENRKAYHGVDRIYPNTSDLLKSGGRINLTLRRVNA
ncbi:alpha-ketoglutarate-dependent dioxygenase AlkB [Rhizobium sp. L1K21]|uniref:alpha-ketoglutarate-dependent dioxygenase AlkB n=1 Tax=Rhizobium sp. L1K21 TaxID=2954933 RepID=UPI0020939476|nr:alpha-ketoglutarate-dependent dioxygenase AlkB [Rhizobium sp. L1K21]MCO6187970.1 alpha-ketoglutarate-dependent dioxygenase AlkB [Rhizobium sp. L1K21]